MKRLFFAIFLVGILTAVPEVSSNTFPHFPYKGVDGAAMNQKQQEKSKKKPDKSASQKKVEKDSAAITKQATKPTSLVTSLNQVCTMFTHLGNMPSTNPRERKAKEQYRDQIQNRLEKLVYAYPKHKEKIHAIIYRMQTDLVLGEPDDDTDAIGRIRERGSRFHCAKIVSFIKSIINQL